MDKQIVVGSTLVNALIDSLKELKESKIELVSKREMAVSDADPSLTRVN